MHTHTHIQRENKWAEIVRKFKSVNKNYRIYFNNYKNIEKMGKFEITNIFQVDIVRKHLK